MNFDTIFLVSAVTYYLIIILSFSIYLHGARKLSIPFASFTNLFYLTGLFLVFLPGFFVANGRMHEDIIRVADRGFDYELATIYLIGAFVTPIALLIGNNLARKRKFILEKISVDSSRLKFAGFIIFVYATFYFIHIPSIPVFELLFGDYFKAQSSRLAITHGFDATELPFLLVYWRAILQGCGALLFLIYFQKCCVNKKLTLQLAIFLFITAFFFIFTIEKAPVLLYLISIFLVYFFVYKQNNFFGMWPSVSVLMRSDVLLYISFFLFFLYAVYTTLFYGDIGDAIYRIFRQTSTNYIQIELYRELGPLGFSGFNSRILEFIGVEQVADLSVRAVRIISGNPDLQSAGGGAYMTVIYFTFGSWFILPLFTYVFCIGFFDRTFLNSFNFVNYRTSPFFAIYLYFIGFHILSAISTPAAIFSFDYILNPGIIINLGFFFLLLRISNSSGPRCQFD